MNNPNDPFSGQWDTLKQMYEDILDIQKKNSEELIKYRETIENKALKRRQEKEKRMLQDLEDEFVELRSKGIYLTQKQQNKLIKQAEKQQETATKLNNYRSRANADGLNKNLGQRIGDGFKALGVEFKHNLSNLGNVFKTTLSSVAKDITKSIGNQINKAMTTYAQYQTGINARLQSTGKDFKSLEKSLSAVAFSPLLKSEDLYNNLAKLVEEGISTNVEQRAFLMTIKDNIATTFDANSTSLKRLIRLQQQDSTASRLGMEAFITRYMNTLVQNTEYLTSSFDNVQSALLEASSLMNMSGANEFEYQVQKWLGAMTGLGLSEGTSSSLAQAIGYLGSGNIENLTNNSIGNLLLMATNRAGLSIGDLMKGGLQGNTTNQLLASIVTFVQDIWDKSKDNNVVLSQLSNEFGLTVSDVRSIANMSEDIKQSLINTNLTTNQMYGELGYQFDNMWKRMSIATLLDNAFNNFAYQTGATMASNPATYALWRIADMIQSDTGGIDTPLATALGTGLVHMPTIDQMLKLGLVGISTFQNIPGIINAVKSIGAGSSLLKAMGISEGSSIISRGADLSTTQSGFTQSQSSYMANSNAGAYTESANMMREQQAAEAQQKVKTSDIDIETIHKDILQIYEVLTEDGVRIHDSSITGLTDIFNRGLGGISLL